MHYFLVVVKIFNFIIFIKGIPTFILIDENNKLITRQGRSVLLSDPTGNNFPWKRQPIYELTENTVHRIVDMPSLILFTGDFFI